MDIGRTTLLMLAAATTITVVARIGQQRAARAAAEAERITTCADWVTSGQMDLRRGQTELKKGLTEGLTELAGTVARLEARMGELMQMGHHVVANSDDHLRAVAGAFEAVGKQPDEVGQARHWRRAQTRRI